MMDELLKELAPVVESETQRASKQYGDRYASAHEAESVLRGAIKKDVLKELEQSVNDMIQNVIAGTIDPDKVITFLKLEQQTAEGLKQAAKEARAEITYIMGNSEKEYYNTLCRQWEKTKKQPPELEKIYNREKELVESESNCGEYIQQIESVIYAINKISGNRQ